MVEGKLITINLLLVILALASALAGVGKLNFGQARFTPDWVALALAFWFASLLVRA